MSAKKNIAISIIAGLFVFIVVAGCVAIWLVPEKRADAAAGIVNVIVLAILVVVTAIYAWRTHVMSQAAKQQADASVKMAEATLCPVIAQWVEETRLPNQEQTVIIGMMYKNTGNGPALNIKWFLHFSEGNRVLKVDERVSMGVYDEEAPLAFSVKGSDAKDGLSILAQYQGVLGPVWQSSLPFKVDRTADGQYYLKNGEPKVEIISSRTKLEEVQDDDSGSY